MPNAKGRRELKASATDPGVYIENQPVMWQCEVCGDLAIKTLSTFYDLGLAQRGIVARVATAPLTGPKCDNCSTPMMALKF